MAAVSSAINYRSGRQLKMRPAVVHAACCAPRRLVFFFFCLFLFCFLVKPKCLHPFAFTPRSGGGYGLERDFRALKYHLWSSTSSGQSLCFFRDFLFCVWRTKVTVSSHTDIRWCCVRRATTGHFRSLESSATTRQCRLPMIRTEQQRL